MIRENTYCVENRGVSFRCNNKVVNITDLGGLS